MENNKLIKLILIISVLNYVTLASPESPTYKVGVIEFDPVTTGTNETNFKNNLSGYKDLLSNSNDADIIIFPESTLNNLETLTFVPDPKDKIVLCNNVDPNPEFLSKLSCWAGQFKKYLVFNIVEKVNCTKESQAQNNDKRPCAADGLTRYNTNIVFDRNGALISRYRKWNLFIEPLKNITVQPEHTTFDTDFGVKFATFTCFDILFWEPTMKLVKDGIKNIIYPAMWFSELPFLTANQIQHAWAFANNVTLLVSGASTPSVGSTGSGIFVGRNGSIQSVMSSRPVRQMYINDVPKHNSSAKVPNQSPPNYSQYPEKLTGLKVTRDETISKYQTVLLNSTNLNVNETVCHDKFCCKFNVVRKSLEETRNTIHYSYRLIAYAGPRTYYVNLKESWLKICAIIACTDDSIDSCGKIFDDNIQYGNTHYFESIEIKGEFKQQEELLIMPNSVDAMFKPIPVNAFDFSSADVGKSTNAVMKLIKPSSDLLTFGIYAQYYDGFNSASRISSYLIPWILGFLYLIYQH